MIEIVYSEAGYISLLKLFNRDFNVPVLRLMNRSGSNHQNKSCSREFQGTINRSLTPTTAGRKFHRHSNRSGKAPVAESPLTQTEQGCGDCIPPIHRLIGDFTPGVCSVIDP